MMKNSENNLTGRTGWAWDFDLQVRVWEFENQWGQAQWSRSETGTPKLRDRVWDEADVEVN